MELKELQKKYHSLCFCVKVDALKRKEKCLDWGIRLSLSPWHYEQCTLSFLLKRLLQCDQQKGLSIKVHIAIWREILYSMDHFLDCCHNVFSKSAIFIESIICLVKTLNAVFNYVNNKVFLPCNFSSSSGSISDLFYIWGHSIITWTRWGGRG